MESCRTSGRTGWSSIWRSASAAARRWKRSRRCRRRCRRCLPEEPSPSLLARTRLRLDEALDAMPQGGFLRRVSQRFRRSVGWLQGAPVMAMVLLLAGCGRRADGAAIVRRCGRCMPARRERRTNAASAVPVVADIDAAQIAGVSSISAGAGVGERGGAVRARDSGDGVWDAGRSADSAAAAGGGAQPRQPGGARRLREPAGAGMPGRSPVLRAARSATR